MGRSAVLPEGLLVLASSCLTHDYDAKVFWQDLGHLLPPQCSQSCLFFTCFTTLLSLYSCFKAMATFYWGLQLSAVVSLNCSFLLKVSLNWAYLLSTALRMVSVVHKKYQSSYCSKLIRSVECMEVTMWRVTLLFLSFAVAQSPDHHLQREGRRKK